MLALGFERPELFEILQDAPEADPLWERRYLQLWLNQLALIYALHQRGLFQNELEISLTRDIKDFMGLNNMRLHWKRYGRYYPNSFRSFGNNVVKEIETGGGPQGATPPE